MDSIVVLTAAGKHSDKQHYLETEGRTDSILQKGHFLCSSQYVTGHCQTHSAASEKTEPSVWNYLKNLHDQNLLPALIQQLLLHAIQEQAIRPC